MDSNAGYIFVLERINFTDRVILDKSEHTYTCGRSRNSHIMCQSLLVSRQHCIFFHSKTELHVTDLKSTNQIFINGVAQKPYHTIKLVENDIIGIGCPNADTKDSTMFAYKLTVIKPPLVINEPNDLSENISNLSVNEILVSNETHDLTHKRKTNQDNCDLPIKILKLDNNSIEINQAAADNGKKQNIIMNTSSCNTEDEDDIEILRTSLKSDQNNAQHNTNSTSEPSKKHDELNDLVLNNSLETDLKRNNTKVTKSTISNNDVQSKTNIDTNSNEENKVNPDQSEKDEDFELVIMKINNIIKEAEKPNAIDNPSNNKGKDEQGVLTKQTNKKSQKDTTTFNKVHLHKENKIVNIMIDDKTKHTQSTMHKRKSRIGINENQEQFLQKISSTSNKINTNSLQSENSETNTNTRNDNIQNSSETNSNFLFNGDVFIKMEDELHIIDDNEEANKITANEISTSPIKLRVVKQEPKTQFSENDVINLSDDEDGVFPCSQLFDTDFDTNFEIKSEIKTETANNDDDKYNRLEDEHEVIYLSDSETEDSEHLWLQKLSRSQVFADNDEDIGNTKDKEANMEADIVKDNDINIDTNKLINENLDKLGSPDTEIKNQRERNTLTNVFGTMQNKDPNLLKDNVRPSTSRDCYDMDVINDDIPEDILSFVHKQLCAGSSSINGKSYGEDSDFNHNLEKCNTFLKKLNLPERKGPEIIDAPHLSKPRRRSSNAIQLTEPNIESILKPVKRLRKDLKIKEKIEDHQYNKEQKHRKMLNKWAECLPSGKKRKTSLSKEEKEALAINRKEKLKQIAIEKKKDAAEKRQQEKRIAKPKAKVSLKTRGDFLIEEQEASASTSKSHTERSTKRPKSTKNVKILNTTENNVASVPSLSDQNRIQSNIFEETTNRVADDLYHTLKLTEAVKNTKIPKKINRVTKTSIPNTVNKISSEPSVPAKEKNENNATNVMTPYSYSPIIKSSLKKNHSTNVQINKRSVCFKEKPEIREYSIEPENSMKRIVGKDAPIPAEKLSARRMNNVVEPTFRLDEFLSRIFLWSPVWLEEQKDLRSTPPIVKESELQCMSIHYRSFEEYYKTVTPLLFLEIWHHITKEFNNAEYRLKRPGVMCSIVRNSISRINVRSTNIFLSTLMIEILVSKEHMQNRIHPVYGDLVCLEYSKKSQERCAFYKVFAYITNVHLTILSPYTHYNKDLGKYVRNPHALLTYTVKTKSLDENDISLDRLQRLKTVTYLRADIRMVQALQYLPQSPLANPILNPTIDAYQLPDINKLKNRSLVTEEELNEKQFEAVMKVTDVIVRKEPKLCFIQGPPGTGKSKVIVNIVAEILHKYKNNKESIKIILCAPSNAAIDELALRLLDIRKKINIKMVRVGRPEAIHPSVKPISIAELAKRNVKIRILQYYSTLNSTGRGSAEEDVSEAYRRDPTKLLRQNENTILMGAEIIACTLKSCYTNQMECIFSEKKNAENVVCIVDEATQSCEAETLIPLMLGVNTLILVGDTNQLPATILSQRAKELCFDQSIFSRVQNAFKRQKNNPIITLNVQYRMAPSISYWPNKYFYGGYLRNAAKVDNTFPFHSYRVLNLNSFQSDDRFSNETEAEFIANTVFCMMTTLDQRKIEPKYTFGILTPYNNQKSLVSIKINEKIRDKTHFDVNTIDGFQGQERDVIIMSCVRTQGIGFLSDKQRLCVALTRAKESLILCGNFNFSTYMKDGMWSSLIADAQSRKVYYNINVKAQPDEIRSCIVR